MTINSALRVALVVGMGLAAATGVEAQTVTPAPAAAAVLTGDVARDAELRQWMEAFADWQRWWVQWANRAEPGWVSSSRPRRAKPEPPEWLADRCAEVIAPEDSLAPACTLLEEWRDDNTTAKLRATRTRVVLQGEAPPKNMWWQHVHVDLLWPATELRHSVYGVIGVHTATTVKDRMQIFLTPGVMLLNMPAVDGTRVWKIATNYGIGYRLFDFTFPGNRFASLHVNIAKSWLLTEPQDVLASRSTDFAGFSISFKRR